MKKEFILLGDVHGNIDHCVQIAKRAFPLEVIQIGDLGIGWLTTKQLALLPSNFKFFVGNHDCRQESYKYSCCLGDFGEYKGLFYVSGADSIDKDSRIEGKSWWRDEELNHQQCNQVLELWEKSTCDTLLCHDCPQIVAESIMLAYDKSTTRMILNEIIKVRKPRRVYFGHWHRVAHWFNEGVEYRCIDINEAVRIEV